MNNLLILITCLALAGCASIQDIATTNKDIASGAAVGTIKHVQLTGTEEMIVNHALNNYIAFSEKWMNVRTNPTKIAFLVDFSQLKEQYLAVERIVEKHWDSYPADKQEKLKTYRDAARDLNKSVNMMIFTNNLYFAMQDAVYLSKTLIGLAKAL